MSAQTGLHFLLVSIISLLSLQDLTGCDARRSLPLPGELDESHPSKRHCNVWLNHILSATPNKHAEHFSHTNAAFLRHNFGKAWVPAGNPTRKGPALTCSNEQGQACLFLEEFTSLWPSACSALTSDAAWPVHEGSARTAQDLDGRHLAAALRGQPVVFVGASIMRQARAAAECAVLRAGVGRSRAEALVRYWGGSRFWADNGGCAGKALLRARDSPKLQAECLAKGRNFQDMLARVRPGYVVISYHPDHYHVAQNVKAQWPAMERDLRHAVRLVRAAGAEAVLLTPSAAHFNTESGGYSRAVYYQDVKVKGQRCECVQPAKHKKSSTFRVRKALLALAHRLQAPAVDFYMRTLSRHLGHKGSQCAIQFVTQFEAPPHDWEAFQSYLRERGERGGNGTVPGWVEEHASRKVAVEPCCDCTHWCYTPLFWDRELVTPLVQAIEKLQAARDKPVAGALLSSTHTAIHNRTGSSISGVETRNQTASRPNGSAVISRTNRTGAGISEPQSSVGTTSTPTHTTGASMSRNMTKRGSGTELLSSSTHTAANNRTGNSISRVESRNQTARLTEDSSVTSRANRTGAGAGKSDQQLSMGSTSTPTHTTSAGSSWNVTKKSAGTGELMHSNRTAVHNRTGSGIRGVEARNQTAGRMKDSTVSSRTNRTGAGTSPSRA